MKYILVGIISLFSFACAHTQSNGNRSLSSTVSESNSEEVSPKEKQDNRRVDDWILRHIPKNQTVRTFEGKTAGFQRCFLQLINTRYHGKSFPLVWVERENLRTLDRGYSFGLRTAYSMATFKENIIELKTYENRPDRAVDSRIQITLDENELPIYVFAFDNPSDDRIDCDFTP